MAELANKFRACHEDVKAPQGFIRAAILDVEDLSMRMSKRGDATLPSSGDGRRQTAKPCRPQRLARRRHGGQAAIEFSFAFILLLMGIFGATASAIWAIENMASINATENSLRLLAGAYGANGTNADTSWAASTHSAAAITLIKADVIPALHPAMFGTQITVLGTCPAVLPKITDPASGPWAKICWQVVGTQVQVHVIGCSSSLVPSMFGITGCKFGVPVNDFATVQQLVFTQ